jgi:DNA modification methylase
VSAAPLRVVDAIAQWPVGQLVPYERNARLHSDHDVQRLAEHISRHGFNKPIEVDEAGVILCGHRRLAAALVLGMTAVPVIQHAHLDEAMKREYRLADNRLTLEGEWDDEMLVAEMAAILQDGGDLAFTGFTDEELTELEADLDREFGDEEVPDPPETPVSRTGDLWHLGAHRVLCGDSTDASVLRAALQGEEADAVWTDPPYNVDYEGTAGKIANDAMTPEQFTLFIRSAFESMASVMRVGAPAYVAHPDTGGLLFRGAFVACGFHLSSCLIWRKSAFALGRSDYHWQHEPVLYGWKKGAAHTWFGGRDQSTVFDVDKPSVNDVHPTMKPVPLIVAMLANSAPRGGLVLDPFGGSGSTLMACEQLGMRAALVELDPRYVDVIIERWQEATGGEATLGGNQSFETISRTRLGESARAG